MARSEFVDHCLELLAPLGALRARRMFGGWGLYAGDVFVAIIAGERLYLKTGEADHEAFRAAGCEPFIYNARTRAVAMSYWSAPAEAMDSPALMEPWARRALHAALRAAATRRAPARSRPPRARRAEAAR
jgi:DNA transformation protein